MFLKFWLVPDNPPKIADCFVVISYAVKDKNTPNRPTRAVIELSYKWWKKFPKAKLIVSTGDNQGMGISNAKVMEKYAENLGIPKGNIVREGRSLNTYENLVYSLKILRKIGFKEPVLVCFDLHTRRVLTTAKKLGLKDFYWLSAYSKGEPGYGPKWLQTSSRFTIFCYEVMVMVYSRLKGWI